MEPHDPSAGWAAGGGHLRASDADRERVIDALKDAFAQGRLTKSELARRLAQRPTPTWPAPPRASRLGERPLRRRASAPPPRPPGE